VFLGYAKGTNYSANLERPLSILGKKLIPDYSLTLWDENFWLIEAKRPRIGKAAFEYDDVSRSS